MENQVDLPIPAKLVPVFATPDIRYRGAHGGRGSAKTRTFALMSAVKAYEAAESGRSGVILCGREYMNSLEESSMEEVKQAIRSVPWLDDYFEIGEKYIRTKNRRVSYVFCGLRHNLDSIKSKARILVAWVDEAEPAFALKWLLSSACSKAAISAAMIVLAACCDRDTTPLTGELVPGRTGRRAFLYRSGAMPVRDMVLIAQSLIQHGIIGKAKVRKLQRHEGSSTSSEFNAFEYISAARTHLGMSREEAEQLTMTEFQMMLAAKFPEQKGFTREEYDSVADDYLARKARRLANKN
ncbi:DUF6246 family protein [Pantoea ananatis]|uniref:DUF6246 family protein n=1 Tax=Pantoea ananas TaxID=553 RepID=UPI000CEB7969|nr:hypothetical protein B9Q16_09015 [Pantoea ananatis]PWK07059.1 phage terminase large subunit [Pantoea ananatis]